MKYVAATVRMKQENEKTDRIPPRKVMVILGRRIPIPQSVMMRRMLGGTLVAGGALGFLPVLGFWMLPLGLVVLSHDSHRVRRLRRKSEIYIWRKWVRRNASPDTNGKTSG